MLLLGHAGSAAGGCWIGGGGSAVHSLDSSGERRPVRESDPARNGLDGVWEVFEDFPGGVAFQDPHDLSDRFAFGGSSLHVAFGLGVP